MKNGSILMWGELPPNTLTGISVSNELIYNILLEQGKRVEVVEEFTWQKSLISKVNKLLNNYFQIRRKVKQNGLEIFYCNIPLSKFGLIKQLVGLCVIKKSRHKIKTYGHLHRGDLTTFATRSRINEFILKKVFNHLDKIIVLSNQFKYDVLNINDKSEIFILPNTSAIETGFNINTKKTYTRRFICIANYIESKGIRELVRCFSSEELKNFKLDVFGNIYENEFYNSINRNIPDNINLGKSLKRTEIEEKLKQYDCLIVPSWNEGQPVVIIEAMSIGMPVIATNVGDISNMLGENYKYMVKEAKNAKLLKDTVLSFDACDDKISISSYLFERYKTLYSNQIYQQNVISLFS